ncbi:MAG: hypothetical protein AB2604_17255 [Candidatus Thiodiazotropha taylori]
MKLDFEAETYSRTGNIAADGIQKLLGNPDMNRLEAVLRESIQNCWDAGLDGTAPECRIAVRDLDANQVRILRERVFSGLNGQSEPLRKLGRCLKTNSLRVLQIADFNTTGLGGSTDPSAVPDSGESTDFVDFLRNIGTPRDTMMGGGTYGYGKASLYAASQCSTILVDSVTFHRGKKERRFMACNIGQKYDVTEGMQKGRYTGRHWWGARDAMGILHPVSNDDAENLANSLGLPERSLDDSGTTIVILEPTLCEDENDAECEIAPAILGILLSNFWPKVIEYEDGSSPMRFSLNILGCDIHIPSPRDVPPLEIFTEALIVARSKEGTEIRSQRPRKRLGNLCTKPGMRLDRIPDVKWPRTSPFSELSHHVALMRPAELVVRYLPGNPLPRDSVEWGGAFIVDDQDHDVEHAFALSEPPAHDDWIPSSMEKGPKKTMVNVGLNRIREIINGFGQRPVQPMDSGSDMPLADIADRLGGSLLAGPGPRLGGGTATGRRGGHTGSRKAPHGHFEVTFGGLETNNGNPCSRYSVRCGVSSNGYEMKAVPEVLLDDRKAVDVAPNGQHPRILAWYDNTGDQISTSDSLSVPPEGGSFSVLVSMPDLVAVRVKLKREMESADGI